MKTSKSKFSDFIDEKYVPLTPNIKIVIAVFIVLIPVLIFFFSFYQPKNKIITRLDKNVSSLSQEIQNVKLKAANLEKFELELVEAKKVFDEKAALLPKEKEIPKLLKDISSLGRNAGLDFLTFKPLPDVPRDFYSEIPVSINVRGPYHNMGYFFDQVSNLKRIVGVSNVKMSSPVKDQGEMLLKSDFKLVTYRFTNVALPKKEEKK